MREAALRIRFLYGKQNFLAKSFPLLRGLCYNGTSMPEGCEKMSKQGDAAYAWFLKGYNCSQSVVAAFAPQIGLTEETALRLSAGFGAGIGRMREVCGAFCGVVTVLSMVYADPADPKDKSRMYALVQEAAEQYRSRNGGSIICRELLAKAGAAPAGGTAAEDRTADYYKKRPCKELVGDAAEILEKYIAEHPVG